MTVFGSINLTDPVTITVSMLIVIVVLIFLELLFEFLEKVAIKYNQTEIFHKLKHELMILGIISFGIFIVQSAAENNPEVVTSEYFISFELAHIVVLFMAFSFIAQAVILVNFTNRDGKEFLKMVRITEEELCDKLKKSQAETKEPTKNQLSLIFWKQIEFKLIGELFYKCHTLPKAFDFGSYAGYQLHTYVASVGEISVLSWIGLAVIVVFNYIRTLVDNSAEDYECRNQPVDELWGCGGECGITAEVITGNSTAAVIPVTVQRYLLRSLQQLSTSVSATTVHDRHLSSGGEGGYISPDEHCYLFFFTYAFFCAVSLNLFIYCVYYAARYYEHAIVSLSIKVSYPDIYDSIMVSKSCSSILSTSFENQHEVYVKILERLKQKADERQEKIIQDWLNSEAYHQANPPHTHTYNSDNDSDNNNNNANTNNDNTNNDGNNNNNNNKTNNGIKQQQKQQQRRRGSSINRSQSKQLINQHLQFEREAHRKKHFKELHREKMKEELKSNHYWDYIHIYFTGSSSSSGSGGSGSHAHTHNNKHTAPAVTTVENPTNNNSNNSNNNSNTNNNNNNKDESSKEQQQQQQQEEEQRVNTEEVFWMQWPGLFFFMVEFSFLLQSFYLAIYFTQLLPIAVEQQNPGWGIALAIMPILGFYLLYLILRRASLIYTTTELDRHIADRVCEESVLQLSLSAEIRAKVEAYFILTEITTEKEKFAFLRRSLDANGNNMIDRIELRAFLGELEIYLTKQNFELIWKLIDYDISGHVTLDEIFVFLFPHMKESLKNEMKLVQALREKFQLIVKNKMNSAYVMSGCGSSSVLGGGVVVGGSTSLSDTERLVPSSPRAVTPLPLQAPVPPPTTITKTHEKDDNSSNNITITTTTTTEQQLAILKQAYAQFDTDHSGALDKDEVRKMCEYLHIPIADDHSFNLLMAATETNEEGCIELKAFIDLMLPDAASSTATNNTHNNTSSNTDNNNTTISTPTATNTAIARNAMQSAWHGMHTYMSSTTATTAATTNAATINTTTATINTTNDQQQHSVVPAVHTEAVVVEFGISGHNNNNNDNSNNTNTNSAVISSSSSSRDDLTKHLL